jgi:hypothetical protein
MNSGPFDDDAPEIGGRFVDPARNIATRTSRVLFLFDVELQIAITFGFDLDASVSTRDPVEKLADLELALTSTFHVNIESRFRFRYA